MTEPFCRLLPWDTQFFGRRIGSVGPHRLTPDQVRAVEDWCRAERIECLYFLADGEDGGTLRHVAQAGWPCVDIRLTLERPLGPSAGAEAGAGAGAGTGAGTGEPAESAAGAATGTPAAASLAARPGAPSTAMLSAVRPSIRPAVSDDLAVLERLAGRSHADSRFYQDGHFPRERCDALYALWIKKSVEGEADAVWVSGPPGEPQGYITCHRAREGAPAKIGLFGVAPQAQGHGLGAALVRAALAWFANEGEPVATVVTQGRNVRAQRAYQRQGFLSRSVDLWHHAWLLERHRSQ